MKETVLTVPLNYSRFTCNGTLPKIINKNLIPILYQITKLSLHKR